MNLSHRRATIDVLAAHLCNILWYHACALTPLPRRRVRRPQPVWCSQVCYASMVSRNAAWRAHRRHPNQATLAALRRATNEFHHSARRARCSHWASFLQDMRDLVQHDPRRAARLTPRHFNRRARDPPLRMRASAGEAPQLSEAPDPDPLSHWSQHFQTVSKPRRLRRKRGHFQRISHRAAWLRSSMSRRSGDMDFEFSFADLATARRHIDSSTAVGVDGIPYSALLQDLPWWSSCLS